MTIPPVTTMPDRFQDECAVFGIYGTAEAAVMTALGLHALQHRGQEATGIVSMGADGFNAHRGIGHVGENFDANAGHLDMLKGYAAIGHNRYSTTGKPEFNNIQPFFSDLAFGGFALAHNGNLTNAARLRQSLIDTGSLMQSTTDTEVILHLVARSHQQETSLRLIDALKQVEGAWSLVTLSSEGLIGVRDPHGIRPLVLGRIGDTHVLSSETCGLDIIGAEYIRDLDPGEMVIINDDGVTSRHPFTEMPSRFCVFEYIYFARPDSIIENRDVYAMRKNIGMELARDQVLMLISSSRFLIQASLPPSAMLMRQAFPLSWGLFAIIMSAGPSFSRPIPAARPVSNSSTTPICKPLRASRSFLSMIRSCAAQLR